jgi:hypothetical protein
VVLDHLFSTAVGKNVLSSSRLSIGCW